MAENFLPENFDVQLQEFFNRVICKEVALDIMWRSQSVKESLKKVFEAFWKEKTRIGESSVCFDTAATRCAYVIRHSTCFASAVANYLLKFNNHGDNKNILFEILETGFLNIFCFGGGPATIVVAIVKVVCDLYHPLWLQTGKKLSIHVTVMDINENWCKTLENVIHCLKNTSEFFKVQESILTYGFIKADITQPMGDDVRVAINSTDILTFVYFVSAVNGSNAKGRSPAMLEGIMQHMKKGSFLFFLDSAADYHYKVIKEAAEMGSSMREVYGPLVEEFHAISLESVRKFMELYAKHFHGSVLMTNIFFCVSSWYKMKTLPHEMELNVTSKSWKKPSPEESDELTKKRNQYFHTVKKIVREYSQK